VRTKVRQKEGREQVDNSPIFEKVEIWGLLKVGKKVDSNN